MFQPVVQLRSGGYIVINQTEALVAIDVNSGRATREHHIEDTALKTNLEASDEIARQLRLRDLAGLVVIDFIDMDEKRNNRTVERRMKEALKQDRARIQVGHISHFGLLEMSRQRIRSSVLESSTDKCPQCGGTGHVRSVSSVSLQLLRSIEEMLLKGATHNIIVRTRTEIALYLLNHKRAHLRTLEERFRITITVNADATISGQTAYVIEKGELVHSLEQAKAIAAQPIAAVPITDDERTISSRTTRPSKRATSRPKRLKPAKPSKRSMTISRRKPAATVKAARPDAAGGAGGVADAAAKVASPAKVALPPRRPPSTAAPRPTTEGAMPAEGESRRRSRRRARAAKPSERQRRTAGAGGAAAAADGAIAEAAMAKPRGPRTRLARSTAIKPPKPRSTTARTSARNAVRAARDRTRDLCRSAAGRPCDRSPRRSNRRRRHRAACPGRRAA